MEEKEMNYNIKSNVNPIEWDEKILGEIVKLNPKDKIPENFEYIDLESVKNGKIIGELKSFTKNTAPSRAQRKLKENDILFSTVRPYQKNHIIVTQNIEDKVASSGFAQLRTNSENSSDFVYHLVHSNYFTKEVNIRCTGTSYPAITGTELITIKIYLPSITEQEKIANFLSSLDERISLQEERIRLLSEQKKGYIQQIFNRQLRFHDDNGNEYPEWEAKQLGETGTAVTGNTPSKSEPEYWENGTHLWITTPDMHKSKNITTSRLKLTSAGVKKARILPAGTLLVTCIASIGVNGVLRNPGATNQQINGLTPNKETNVDFLYYSLDFNKDKFKRMAGKTAVPIINKTLFEKFTVMLPSLPEQEKIANFLSVLDEQISLAKEKLNLYKQEKQGHMQKIFGRN